MHTNIYLRFHSKLGKYPWLARRDRDCLQVVCIGRVHEQTCLYIYLNSSNEGRSATDPWHGGYRSFGLGQAQWHGRYSPHQGSRSLSRPVVNKQEQEVGDKSDQFFRNFQKAPNEYF